MEHPGRRRDGLCLRMNQLMEDGHSQRKAAQIMAEESGGKWPNETILTVFKRAMGSNEPTSKKSKPEKPEHGGSDGDFLAVRPWFDLLRGLRWAWGGGASWQVDGDDHGNRVCRREAMGRINCGLTEVLTRKAKAVWVLFVGIPCCAGGGSPSVPRKVQ